LEQPTVVIECGAARECQDDVRLGGAGYGIPGRKARDAVGEDFRVARSQLVLELSQLLLDLAVAELNLGFEKIFDNHIQIIAADYLITYTKHRVRNCRKIAHKIVRVGFYFAILIS
jgi:hypothetical protein